MYVEIFDKLLRDLSSKSELGVMYIQLFSLLPKDEREKHLKQLHKVQSGKDSYYKTDGKEVWFPEWHKSIRNTDFFQNCYQKQHRRLLSFEEQKTMVDLRDFFYKNGLNEEDAQKRKDDEKEKFTEYHRLSRLFQEQSQARQISGILDSLLYNTVHLDTKNEIYKVFQRLFLEVELEKQTV